MVLECDMRLGNVNMSQMRVFLIWIKGPVT